MDTIEYQQLRESISRDAAHHVGKEVADREASRFRTFYIVLGVISFIGIGVITQLIDLYATRATTAGLSEVREEFESAKLLSQLLVLSNSLDLRDSVSQTDRDAATRLLRQAASNQLLRSEPTFTSLLQKIIVSLSLSDNPLHISQIYDLYKRECLESQGISVALVIHYGREYLASSQVTSDTAVANLKRLEQIFEALRSHSAESLASAFELLVLYKDGRSSREEIVEILSSLQVLDAEQRSQFLNVFEIHSDVSEMSIVPTPKIIRQSEVVQNFRREYEDELSAL